MKLYVAWLNCNHLVHVDSETPHDVLTFCFMCGMLSLVDRVVVVDIEQ